MLSELGCLFLCLQKNQSAFRKYSASRKKKDLTIDDGEIMVSFKVTALFGSIHPKLVKESIATVLHTILNLANTPIQIPKIMVLSTSASVLSV